jgi:hypothetical protein
VTIYSEFRVRNTALTVSSHTKPKKAGDRKLIINPNLLEAVWAPTVARIKA